MSRDPAWMLEHRSNTFSQTGEDGVIAKALEILPGANQWCVEFGAWDGRKYSNTRALIENRGYSAVLIEGNRRKYADLLKTYAGNDRVKAVHAFVGFTARDGLDSILAATPIPRDFDILSIDIDGNDYHTWNALTAYQPKLVCIEFNPTIATEVTFVQAADPAVNQGSSLRALVELGRKKGYELISVLAFNAFFVRSCDYPLFGIDDNRPEVLRKELGYITYFFSGFDGSVHLDGNRTLPWHHLPLKESRLQQLPFYLRIYPMNYGRVRRALLRLRTDWRGLVREAVAKLFGDRARG